jgi:hypothetical protein
VRAVSYLVRAGERPWPTLDDTGERSADFAVDSDSHLHRADAGWTCPTCRRTGCSACRTEDQIDLCGDCSQPACGRCRRGEHERVVDVPRSCVICGVHACQRCGRDIDASSCPCCGRTVCGVCGAGDRCTTCASVRPLDTDEIGLLPEELHAVGLTVQSAVDHDARIIVLEGPTRREVAVLRNGAVVEWWRTGPLSAGLLPFVYATTRTGDVATIVETDDEDLAATTEAVRLYSSPRSVLTWRLEDDRGSTFGHSNAPLPIEDPHASDQDLIGVLAGDVASGRRLPLPIEDEIRLGRVRSLFSPVAAAPRFHLIIEPHRSEETVALQADGLAWSRIAGGRPFTTVEQWCRDANGPEAAGWHPSPQIVAWASAGPASASVLAFGPLIAIAISSDSEGEHPRHVIVRDVVDRTDVLSLGTYLTGSPAAVRVHRAVTPEQIIPIEVLNGQLEKRTFTPTCCPSSQGIGDDRVSEVLAAWPIPSVELPTFGSVPDAGFLWYGLLDTLGVLAEPTIPFCDIGASVEERWTTPYGTLTFTYEVNPDALSGAIHLLSGTFARRFYVDRSGHLVAVVRRCPYCSEETCDECSDVVAPCQLCGIEVCVRCAGSERTAHLCPACASLSPLGWWKRHGRPHLKGRERQVLRGMDARHQVDIVVDGRQVNLYQTKEGLDAPSTSPVMTTKLRDVLNTAFGAPIVPDVADKRLDGEAR